MTRGLTEEPEPQPENDLPTIQEMDEAIQELYSYLSKLGVEVEQLKDIMSKALVVKKDSEFLNGL